MNVKQLHIIQHTVGHDGVHKRPGWRNNFCAGVGSRDHELCTELVEMGLMKTGGYINDDRDQYFKCTEKGMEMACSPYTPPKVWR